MEPTKRLSCRLLEMGFFSALGTEERTPIRRYRRVHRGNPRKYDSRNDVTAVYDEEGRPWICQREKYSKEEFALLTQDYDLHWGCYVPHASDQGYWFREVMPTL